MPKLSLKNVNKVYPNGFQAVHNFDLDIENGEFIILVGPSGCGKSTTLRMIAGLEDITSGQFYINDILANALSPKARGVAMVFQSYALYPHLSVYDNLGFGLNLQGLDEDTIEEKVIKVARVLGIEDYLDRKPRELSGGQRQRVAVGRAIIRKVDIFLMDEPLSNLDAKQRVLMRSEITLIHRQIGATTIYVTHDQTEAMTMGDRIVVMKDGYIQQIGTPEQLYFKPVNMFVAGFIGEPPMNFIDCEFITENGKKKIIIDQHDLEFDITEVIDNFHFIQENQELVLGFRPEDINLNKHNINGLMIKAKFELSELLGDSANVYAKINDHGIILKIDSHDIVDIKDDVYFTIPLNSIYLFDRNNGKSLNK